MSNKLLIASALCLTLNLFIVEKKVQGASPLDTKAPGFEPVVVICSDVNGQTVSVGSECSAGTGSCTANPCKSDD